VPGVALPDRPADQAEQHASRRAALAADLAERDLAAVLVTRLVNVRYLTGLASSNAAVLVAADGTAVLATDGRYVTQAARQAPGVELVVTRALGPDLLHRAVHDGATRVGVEEHDLTLAGHADLVAAEPAVELVPAGRPVERLRRIKDDGELALLATACAVSVRALEELWSGRVAGRTERAVARDLEDRMLDLGADGIAFPTIVAAGPNSAVPHHSPTDREIAAGDLLKVDFGAQVGGYHADCTRTVVVGQPPQPWQRDLHALVRQAQAAGVAALAPGVECLAIDRICRDVLAAAGHAEHFTHGTGHGVGLEIHEAPSLGYHADGRLADRTPVTVEPGVYLPDRGGVRIEDTLVVRAAGTQTLTDTTTDLLVVGA
jgi:Xaa-Pro aminopeptidase